MSFFYRSIGQSNSTSSKSLLDIQDPNIIFEEDCVMEGVRKGKRCKYISSKLTYTPTYCGKCGVENIDIPVYKNGTQLSRIILPVSGANPTYLLLQKQRFMCRVCQCSFTAKTPNVQRQVRRPRSAIFAMGGSPRAPRKASIWNGKQRSTRIRVLKKDCPQISFSEFQAALRQLNYSWLIFLTNVI